MNLKAMDFLENYAKEKEKLYIVPSREGMLFIGVNFTLFLMGLIYASNLILLLSFSLFAALLLIMFQTHAHLEKFELPKFTIQDATVKDSPKLFIHPMSKFIQFEIHTNKGAFSTKVIKNERETSALKIQASKRGRYQTRYLKAWTKGERNFFYVWTYRKINKVFHVFPQPEFTRSMRSATLKETLSGGGEFNRHLRYTQGNDSQRIDWKVYARSDQLLIKEFQENAKGGLLIHEDSFEGSKEEKISQMAWLVNYSLMEQIDWELKGRDYYLSIDQGPLHWRKSMEILSEA